MSDYLFRGDLARLDPDVYELTQLEAERQARKIILIPSESTAPMAVREALSSAFQNIYAEGYPEEETRWMSEEEILDYPARLAEYRRNGDPRYYKGVEYADVVEALAQLWSGQVRWKIDSAEHPHEAGKLMLDSTKAHTRLGWRPRLGFDDAIRLTAEWYGRFMEGKGGMREASEAQIRYYLSLA